MSIKKAPHSDLERTTSVKDAAFTDITSLSPEDMTLEDIAAFEIDPVIESQVRWAYDKRILPAAFCMYFFSALVCSRAIPLLWH
jgi:hypothetical protein